MSRFAYTYEDPDYEIPAELLDEEDESTSDSYDPFDTVNS
jgi:hypothetical protein